MLLACFLLHDPSVTLQVFETCKTSRLHFAAVVSVWWFLVIVLAWASCASGGSFGVLPPDTSGVIAWTCVHLDSSGEVLLHWWFSWQFYSFHLSAYQLLRGMAGTLKVVSFVCLFYYLNPWSLSISHLSCGSWTVWKRQFHLFKDEISNKVNNCTVVRRNGEKVGKKFYREDTVWVKL